MTHARTIKTLITFALCYVLMVQGFATPYAMTTQDSAMIHAFCLNGQSASADAPSPESPVSWHDHKTACCLIFGSGDLPRVTSIFSIFTFTFHPPITPSDEFQFRVEAQLAYAPSQPRAPPCMG